MSFQNNTPVSLDIPQVLNSFHWNYILLENYSHENIWLCSVNYSDCKAWQLKLKPRARLGSTEGTSFFFFHFRANWSFRSDWSSSTVGKLTTCMSNHRAAPLIHPLSQSNTFVCQQTTGKYHLTAKLWNWHPGWLFVWLTSTVKQYYYTVLCGPVPSH